MHLIAWLRTSRLSDSEAAERIWAAGVDCLPLSIFCDTARLRPGIMLGFACAPEREIDANVRRLANALRCALRGEPGE